MSIIATAGEKKEFNIQPQGNHQAVCFDVFDLGLQKGEWQGKAKIQHKIYIGWELNERIESNDDFNGKRYRIYKKYTLTLDDRGNLSKDLISWRGKAFSDEEVKAFDIENLIGANCMLNIIHNDYNGKTYANVSTVASVPKGLPLIKAETPRSIPDWIKKIQDQAVMPDNVMNGLPEDSVGLDSGELPPF